MDSSVELPAGTVTFLFTDIEGSTRLLKELRERYADALGEHQRILRAAFAEHGGHEIDTQGDAFFVAFRRAKDAVAAALDCQRGLQDHEWPDDAELRVRMGIHTGEPAAAGERYVGLGVHRTARIAAAGHGGQVLVSQSTRELLRDDPLPGVTLRDLGEHQLKDLDEPERLYQLAASDLLADFPPLRAAAPAAAPGSEQTDAVLVFRILGPLEVAGERGAVELGGPKQRATLAILLLSANRVVSIDHLADELYAGAAPVTALKQVQRQISDLRKVLGPASPIETRPPGYTIRLAPEQLDLILFERLTADATEALAEGEVARAAELLHQALAFWRGPPLADLSYESFARAPIERLEEIRLAALEQRIEAELALGRHAQLVGELRHLVSEHPLREGFCSQLMLALYRSGRQAEALETYRRTRRTLDADFGLEPSPALQTLERRILTQDASLELAQPEVPAIASAFDRDRALLAAAADEVGVARVLSVAEPLASLPARELIVLRLVADERGLPEAVASMDALRGGLEGNVRVAAFTTEDPAADVVRLADAYDVELVLVGAPGDIDAGTVPRELAALFEGSPADVGIVGANRVDWTRGSGVFVPFGGAEHDWAALELGAWLASAAAKPLRLVGVRGDPGHARRDASRLLANASLVVQRLAHVTAAPVLAEASAEALVEAVEQATLVVIGVSVRWRGEGIGAVRRTLVRQTRRPLVLVHRGRRPGGLAPRDARTRFSWTLEA
jgi:class 3 adenylate cyclase/DNA-binding SARP family transcriptional activator